MAENYHYLELYELAELLRTKAISPVELTKHYLQRIEELDGELNAFNLVTNQLAQSQAVDAEREILKGEYRGPLHGIPIAVKDIFDIQGTPTTASMKIHRDSIATQDATVVTRLREAGAVMLGKTNLTEGVYGEHLAPFGTPVNPWNKNYWPGASSSGSGVAVAAGLCAAALGSETGGSIRLPSAANGVVGLKPTWGRVSRYGVFELAATLDHVGPIARSASDAGQVLAAIAGADANDPTASHLPVADFAENLSIDASSIRVGVDMPWIENSVDTETGKAFTAALEGMTSLGFSRVDISIPDVSEMIWDWFPICAAQTALAHAETYPAKRAEYGPALASLLDMGLALSGVEYQQLLIKREVFAGKFNALFDHVDVIALPVLAFPSPSNERMENLDDDLIAGIHQFTCPFNLSRHPSIVLPCGVTENNMPIVFQLIGKYFDEQTLIAVGHEFQSNTRWHNRHPDI
ncbi:MAG: amidase [Pseudomonadota bacterium]